jgi:hypothetical protein
VAWACGGSKEMGQSLMTVSRILQGSLYTEKGSF